VIIEEVGFVQNKAYSQKGNGLFVFCLTTCASRLTVRKWESTPEQLKGEGG